MNWKDLIKPPPAEGYIKNSSNLVDRTFLFSRVFFITPLNGYGAVIALIAALNRIKSGQKMLIAQNQ